MSNRVALWPGFALAMMNMIACSGSPNASGGGVLGTERYEAAQSVLQDKCVRCHSRFEENSEQDWIAMGYVLPGDSAQSPIYRVLKGSQVGGPESMPKVGTISEEERERIRLWIDEMQHDNSISADFKLASSVISSKCTMCHRAATGLPDFVISTEGDWIDSGFVVPGSPSTSMLFRRINGAGLGGSQEDMPFDLPPLEGTEVAAIEAWIERLD